MPLPVIANCFRVTFNWSSQGGVTAHNVLHFTSITGDESQLAAALDAHSNGNMFYCNSSAVGVTTYTILPLDGSTAGTVFTAAPGFTGSGSGEIIPAEAAVLSIRSGTRGPQGRGRLYCGPVTEDRSVGGSVTDLWRGYIVSGWSDFQADMYAETEQWLHGVASYAHAAFYPALSYSVRGPMGVVRRRQQQLVH